MVDRAGLPLGRPSMRTIPSTNAAHYSYHDDSDYEGEYTTAPRSSSHHQRSSSKKHSSSKHSSKPASSHRRIVTGFGETTISSADSISRSTPRVVPQIDEFGYLHFPSQRESLREQPRTEAAPKVRRSKKEVHVDTSDDKPRKQHGDSREERHKSSKKEMSSSRRKSTNSDVPAESPHSDKCTYCPITAHPRRGHR